MRTDPGNTIKVTSITLTLNESDFIEDCLNHLRPYVDAMLVVDSCSEDDTVKKAVKIADAVANRLIKGHFDTLRNYGQNLAPTNWVLHCDADERFNKEFLENMKQIIFESNVKCFRFPRVNLDQSYPHQSDPEDHQVRLLDKRYGVWVRPVHEIVWSPHLNKPLDQCGSKYVKCLPQYPIVHLARPKQDRKQILERWKQIEAQ